MVCLDGALEITHFFWAWSSTNPVSEAVVYLPFLLLKSTLLQERKDPADIHRWKRTGKKKNKNKNKPKKKVLQHLLVCASFFFSPGPSGLRLDTPILLRVPGSLGTHPGLGSEAALWGGGR